MAESDEEVAGTGPVAEYALRLTSGDMVVHCSDPETEQEYPLARWFANQRNPVYRRVVTVVEDWVEVTEP